MSGAKSLSFWAKGSGTLAADFVSELMTGGPWETMVIDSLPVTWTRYDVDLANLRADTVHYQRAAQWLNAGRYVTAISFFVFGSKGKKGEIWIDDVRVGF